MMTASFDPADRSLRQHAEDLLNFIDASPSPWHVVTTIEAILKKHNFSRLNENSRWQLQANRSYYVIRDGSSVILFYSGSKPLPRSGFRIVGAHTDSPGLRIKPQGGNRADRTVRLAVEIYGGPILATFSDRDLSIAGRICLRQSEAAYGIDTRLVKFDKPLVRLPNLAIHMNRTVNEDGLKYNKQTQLPLLFSINDDETSGQQQFLKFLSASLDIDPEQILSWDLNIFDTQKGSIFGPNEEFIANSQLDNLASCHAALTAFNTDTNRSDQNTTVCAFFDHEEIGSQSLKGADGAFLSDTLERIAIAFEVSAEGYKQALANSFLISADMAHAYQPNFPSAYEPDHKVYVNAGPVIKINSNQRYTSESVSEAMFIHLCEEADVPWQKYSHRCDIPCGSTIGPMTAARLGIRSVDVGNPMWAMHSARESAGVIDHTLMTKVLCRFFTS